MKVLLDTCVWAEPWPPYPQQGMMRSGLAIGILTQATWKSSRSRSSNNEFS